MGKNPFRSTGNVGKKPKNECQMSYLQIYCMVMEKIQVHNKKLLTAAKLNASRVLRPPFSVIKIFLMKYHKSSKSQKTQSLTKSLLDIIVSC